MDMAGFSHDLRCPNMVSGASRSLCASAPQSSDLATVQVCGTMIAPSQDGWEQIGQCPSCLGHACRECGLAVQLGIEHPCGTTVGKDFQVCPNSRCANRIPNTCTTSNKIQCPCGQHLCFACGEVVREDSHWHRGEPCSLAVICTAVEQQQLAGEQELEEGELSATEELEHEMRYVTRRIRAIARYLAGRYQEVQDAGVQPSEFTLAAHQLMQFIRDLNSNVRTVASVMMIGVGPDREQLVADVQAFLVRHNNIANNYSEGQLNAWFDAAEQGLRMRFRDEVWNDVDEAGDFYFRMLPAMSAEVPQAYRIGCLFAVQ